MSDIDILAALDASLRLGDKRCRLGKFLDAIPAETPHRDELIRLVETEHDPESGGATRSAKSITVSLAALGFDTTSNPVLDHRQHVCRCYR